MLWNIHLCGLFRSCGPVIRGRTLKGREVGMRRGSAQLTLMFLLGNSAATKEPRFPTVDVF